MRKVAIVVLHFAKRELTAQCLWSISSLRHGGFSLEVIVVNNNPQENLETLKKQFRKFVFLKTPSNLGFAGGNNFGIRQALREGADEIFLVNNDTLLDKELLVNLTEAAGLDKKRGILGPKIYFAPGHEFHQERYQAKDRGKVLWYAGGRIDWQNVLASHWGVDEVDNGQYNQSAQTGFVSGCAMFVKRKVFEKIGLFDESYFLYWEDVDFCQRAQKAGFKVVYLPAAKIWHFDAGSSSVGGPLHDYFITRNRLLFGMKYAPWRSKLALLRESLRLLVAGRPWQKTGVRDFYFRKFAKGSWKDEKEVK